MRFPPCRTPVWAQGFGWFVAAAAALAVGLWAAPAHALQAVAPGPWPWWVWPLLLFGLTLVLGVFAVLAGIGGGVLFVPVVSGFLPVVHLDFVRGAGLMVGLAGALAAGPDLLRLNLAHLRLAIPAALVASFASIFGALLGLALPSALIQVLLGVAIIAISCLMFFSKPAAAPFQGRPDPLAVLLGIHGPVGGGAGSGPQIWRPRRMVRGLLLFSLVGLMAGMFGQGAGWANVPVLNLVMGVPLKIAVGTSYFLLAITNTTAASVYLQRGAMIPLIVVPSVLGIMVGARVGARLLAWVRPAMVRRMVILVLMVAGLRALLRGFGI